MHFPKFTDQSQLHPQYTQVIKKKQKKNEITDLSYLEKLIIDESC